MRNTGDGRERVPSRHAAANDNDGPEARSEAAEMTLARLPGRQIARERFDRLHAANDDKPAGEASEE